jgi:hypothetical protein
MGGTSNVGLTAGTPPIGSQTPKPTGQQTPVNGRPVGGKTPKFFKEVAKGLTSAFKSIGKNLSKLGPKRDTAVSKGYSKAAGKAIDRYIAARAANQSNPTQATKDALQTARQEMRKTLLKELNNSPLMQASQNEPKQNILHNSEVAYATDVSDCLLEAFNSLMTTPGVIAEARQKGISIDQLVGLHLYTTQAYGGINSELRTGQPCGFVTELCNTMRDAWDKLDKPVYVTNRLVNLPSSIDAMYQKGKTVTDPGIGSAAHNVGNVFGGDQQSHVITVIPSDNTLARDVSWLSATKGEDESLFPPGSQFEVLLRDNASKPTQVGGTKENPVFDFRVNLLVKEVNTETNPWTS